jgi:hypothetical protein
MIRKKIISNPDADLRKCGADSGGANDNETKKLITQMTKSKKILGIISTIFLTGLLVEFILNSSLKRSFTYLCINFMQSEIRQG